MLWAGSLYVQGQLQLEYSAENLQNTTAGQNKHKNKNISQTKEAFGQIKKKQAESS